MERLQRDLDTTTRVARDLRSAITKTGGASVKPRAIPRPAHNVADAGDGKPGFSAAHDLAQRNLDLEKYVDEGASTNPTPPPAPPHTAPAQGATPWNARSGWRSCGSARAAPRGACGTT